MKLKSFIAVLFAGSLMFSVQGAGNKKEDSKGTPSFSVKAFYSALAKADFVNAKKYLAAKELIQLVNFLESVAKASPETKEDTKKEFAHMAKAKFISEKITGDKAVVVISYVEKGKTKKDTVKLQKTKGVWLIAD